MNRIASLVRYDWMLHKHNIKLTYGVIALIYICIALLYFISKSALSFDTDFQQLPQIIATFCLSFFNYAQWAIVILMASIVTEKFCYPRTATAYLPLPGTPLEKFCVVCIDFFAAWVGIKVLFLIMFYLTMGVCAISSPDLDWAQNGFALLLPSEAGTMITNMINEMQGADVQVQMENIRANGAADFNMDGFMNAIEKLQQTSFYMNPFGEIAGVAFYLILCMLFKTNVQIKAIGCMVLSYIVYIIASIIAVFCFLGHLMFSVSSLPHSEADPIILNGIFGSLQSFLEFMTCCLYGMPFLAAALLWVFYYQIKHKQAK